jgi:hypothetical protein
MNLNDLDLSTIDSGDVEKLGSKIEEFYAQDNVVKATLSYHWERNHLMLDGNQWIVWDSSTTGGKWSKLETSPANAYIPKPVTNYIFDAYQTLKAYLLKNKPRSTVRPNTQNHVDKTAAKIAELVLETNWERLKDTENYEYAASCLITYGTVFKKDYWDCSAVNMVKVPKMQPPQVDPMTGQPSGEPIQATGEDGLPAFDMLPLGDVNTQVIEPYRMSIDPLAVNLHEARWIMEYSIRPIPWIKENYDKQDPGYTGRVEEVKEEKTLPNSMRRFFQLRNSSGVKGAQTASTGSGQQGSIEMIENAAVVKEYYERPSQNYPKGRLIIVANKVVLYVGDSPYEGPEQGDWHPYSCCKWEPVPGRFWGKSPFDDAVEIQKQINSIDSVVILTRKTMAVPQKLVPQGSVPPGQWTGQPGQEVSYRPGPSGEMPSTVPASGVDAQVWEERKQKVSDLKNITGAVDILKGDRPPGVTAASALSMLYEVGTGKLFPILDRWKYFTESSQKKQLRLVAHKYREPRPSFIRMLISRNKDLTEAELTQFLGEDLHDNCNVIIEAASSIPKLKAAEHALLLELAQYGVLNLDNPQNKQEFLSRFGILGFDSNYSKDVKRAEWENDLLDNLQFSPDNKPVRLETDDDAVHIDVHSNRTKEPSFMALPFPVQQAFFMHIQEHTQAKQQKEMEQQMQAMAMGMPPTPPPPSPNQMPPQKASKGSGIDAKTKKMLMPDLPQGPGTG